MLELLVRFDFSFLRNMAQVIVLKIRSITNVVNVLVLGAQEAN